MHTGFLNNPTMPMEIKHVVTFLPEVLDLEIINAANNGLSSVKERL